MKLVMIAGYFLKIWDDLIHPKLWAFLSAIGLFITQYIFSQWAFAIGFFIIFICDTISGSFVALRTGKYEGKIFREKLFDKCVAYFTIIIAFSAGTKVTLQDSHINLIQYLNVPFYSLFIAVELRSIANSWYKYKRWPWLKELLEIFSRKKDENLDQPKANTGFQLPHGDDSSNYLPKKDTDEPVDS
tara:strand:+ start:34253 stop:34813 length:561 start_codon:yes stop_codon:yes gene_type:complete